MNLQIINHNRIKDLTNFRFGRLTATKLHSQDKFKRKRWLCMCDCGTEKVIASRHLVNGKINSCGCLARESSANNGRKGSHKISGPRCRLYKPELSDTDRETQRNLVEVREWRRKVYEKYNYTCDVCKERGSKLQAHHLNCWSRFKEQRFDVENGVCLCSKHHKEFHHMYMNGEYNPCTREDYYNYKEAYNEKK